MLEQKVKAAWRAFIAAKDPSADVSERAWEDLHFTERNAWFSAFRAFVVPTDDPQPVQEPLSRYREKCADGSWCLHGCLSAEDCYTAPQPQPVQEPVTWECLAGGFKKLTEKQYAAQPESIKRHYSRIAPAQRPLTRERVMGICTEAGYDTAPAKERADFINGIRHGEAAHRITGPAS